jgi:hypothetical protein
LVTVPSGELAEQLSMLLSERKRLTALAEANESKIQSTYEALAAEKLAEMERHGPDWALLLTPLDTRQEPTSLVEARERLLASHGLSAAVIHGRVTLRLRRLNRHGSLSSFGLHQETAEKVAAGIRMAAPYLQAGPDGRCTIDLGDAADGRELFLDLSAGMDHVQLGAYIHDLVEDHELLAEGELLNVVQAAFDLFGGR